AMRHVEEGRTSVAEVMREIPRDS
ncbi:MAG: hypothetical protein RLZZ397_148, partial [Pseudomonadota bacterium]